MINWDKPLLVKGKDGNEWRVTHRRTGSINRDMAGNILRIICLTTNGFDSEWFVDEEGYDTNGIMPRVYNKKPEPKINEYWLCEGNDFNGQAVLRFHGSHWEGAYEEHGLGSITPIDKMERVGG